MAKEPVTAEAVSKAILQRITTGQYAPGDRLPPVRKLAEEIGSNRNTVNKAYQMLFDLGMIENSRSGRRGYTVKRVGQAGSKTKSELLNHFYQHSVEMVWQGMAAGLTAEEMFDQLKHALDEVFGHSKVDLIFFECNDYDTQEMGKRLNEVLQMPVEYRNLSHFYKNPAAMIRKFDLIITTYHHLAEINTTISQHGFPPGKVIGIDTRLTADSMLKIARFPKNRIGVVCTNQNTAHMIKHILFGYHPEWEIEALSVEDDREAIRRLAQISDHFIVTHTSVEDVSAMTGREPDVVVNFQIDEQSMAFLNQRIHRVRMDKIRNLQSDTH